MLPCARPVIRPYPSKLLVLGRNGAVLCSGVKSTYSGVTVVFHSVGFGVEGGGVVSTTRNAGGAVRLMYWRSASRTSSLRVRCSALACASACCKSASGTLTSIFMLAIVAPSFPCEEVSSVLFLFLSGKCFKLSQLRW